MFPWTVSEQSCDNEKTIKKPVHFLSETRESQ